MSNETNLNNFLFADQYYTITQQLELSPTDKIIRNRTGAFEGRSYTFLDLGEKRTSRTTLYQIAGFALKATLGILSLSTIFWFSRGRSLINRVDDWSKFKVKKIAIQKYFWEQDKVKKQLEYSIKQAMSTQKKEAVSLLNKKMQETIQDLDKQGIVQQFSKDHLRPGYVVEIIDPHTGSSWQTPADTPQDADQRQPYVQSFAEQTKRLGDENWTLALQAVATQSSWNTAWDALSTLTALAASKSSDLQKGDSGYKVHNPESKTKVTITIHRNKEQEITSIELNTRFNLLYQVIDRTNDNYITEAPIIPIQVDQALTIKLDKEGKPKVKKLKQSYQMDKGKVRTQTLR